MRKLCFTAILLLSTQALAEEPGSDDDAAAPAEATSQEAPQETSQEASEAGTEAAPETPTDADAEADAEADAPPPEDADQAPPPATVETTEAESNEQDDDAEPGETLDTLYEGGGDLSEVSLEALLAYETSVSSKLATSVREAPGIVTIIEGDQIRRTGARDLMDVLRRVAGFEFGTDVQGVVGLGFRGNWGHEGKILLLWNGQMLNETLFSTLQFGNHYPVENIKKIEIIRGPGSVIYGGYAELAVINVITRGAELEGFSVTGTYGQSTERFVRGNVNIAYGEVLEELDDLELSMSGTIGQGRAGDGFYNDFFGNSYRGNRHEQDPMMLNIGIKYKGLRLTSVIDNYRNTQRDAFDEALSEAVRQRFTSYLVGAEYDWEVSDRLTITPAFNYSRYLPWRVFDDEAGGVDLQDLGLRYSTVADRYNGRLALTFDVFDGLTLFGGVDGYYERAKSGVDEVLFGGTDETVDYGNIGVFGEVNWENDIVNVFAGARFEYHTLYGDFIVPRLALTRVFGDFHAKALFSMAYRAPSIENIALNEDIKREFTRTFEIEAGYRITDNHFVSVNAYDTQIQDPIIYFFDEDLDEEFYLNFDETGTRGVELEYKMRYSRVEASASYSFYTGGGIGTPDLYDVPNDSSLLLGFPAHKFVLIGSLFLGDFTVSPIVKIHSPKPGFFDVDVNDEPVIDETDVVVLADLYVSYAVPALDGLDIGIGAYNIFDANDRFVQPYNGFHGALPGRSREFLGRITYTRSF